MGSDRSGYRRYEHVAWYFNPRSRMGSDLTTRGMPTAMNKFQSTLPHGERRSCHLSMLLIMRRISIHAPAWGATVDARLVPIDYAIISIHAPAWGATVHTVQMALNGFQSTLPHGERLLQLYQRYPDMKISIHAPAWGATATFSAFLRTTAIYGGSHLSSSSASKNFIKFTEKTTKISHNFARTYQGFYVRLWFAPIQSTALPG